MVSTEYHHRTKHDFHRFARSLGYLDWAAQPDPFRRFAGAGLRPLPRLPRPGDLAYGGLFDGRAAPAPLTLDAVGEFLRCAVGLSAWKQHGSSRWALRVNPSSGNLHPTETYVVVDGAVCHYAPGEHALEVRATLPDAAAAGRLLVGLTSIPWREAWKYGERAFRYCQHDVGHAIGALRVSAALLGWTLRLADDWSDAEVATLLGLDRAGDFADAECEEAECLLEVTTGGEAPAPDRSRLLAAARRADWSGRANRLSPSHVEWEVIDRVAAATRHPGASEAASRLASAGRRQGQPIAAAAAPEPRAREVILRRRSAVAFDARSTLPRDRFLAMLGRLDAAAPPFDALTWPPQVHLLIFVHRVEGLAPGLYAWLRDRSALAELRPAMRPEFLWENVATGPGAPGDSNGSLFLLVPADVRFTANRLSCDQAIASDGFFSLGMLARFAPALAAFGESFYRRLFWECGLIGQVLYLEAEAAGARSTGIGCFYDDRVHELLGLANDDWQSLYHFSMGVPVDDTRIATTSGYEGSW